MAEDVVCTASQIACIIFPLLSIVELSNNVNPCEDLENVVGIAVIKEVETVAEEKVNDCLAEGLSTVGLVVFQ